MARKELSTHEQVAKRLSQYLCGGICYCYDTPDHSEISVYNRNRGVGVTVKASGIVGIRVTAIASYGTTREQFRTIRHIKKLVLAAMPNAVITNY